MPEKLIYRGLKEYSGNVCIIDPLATTWIILATLSFLYISLTIDFTKTIAIKSLIGFMFLLTGLAFPIVFGEKYVYQYTYTAQQMEKEFLYINLAVFSVIMANVVVYTTANVTSKLGGFVHLSIVSQSFFVILMAVSEEAFFRNFLQRTLEQYKLPWTIAIVITSGIWAMYHYFVYYSQPLTLAVIFASGLGLGYAFHKTRRISITMSAHAIVNLIASLV